MTQMVKDLSQQQKIQKELWTQRYHTIYEVATLFANKHTSKIPVLPAEPEPALVPLIKCDPLSVSQPEKENGAAIMPKLAWGATYSAYLYHFLSE